MALMSKLSNDLSRLTKIKGFLLTILSLTVVSVLIFGFSQRKANVIDESETTIPTATDNKGNLEVNDIKDSTIGIATGNGASVNFYHSADYKALQKQHEQAQQRVKDYPDDGNFRKELQVVQQQIEDFKRDVIKLAEDFTKIPINTERLRLAKQHFDAGEYQAAWAILDAESMGRDQEALLSKQQHLQAEQKEITDQLKNNANEYLLKAKLTAIDYSLADRIVQTSKFFDLALKSARTPENLFEYANFLGENNQYSASERLYTETLTDVRQLVNVNPAYLPFLATTLNNLGLLVSNDNGRWAEAEYLLTEALTVRRQLAKDKPEVYLPDVVAALNHLGGLLSFDSGRRAEAECFFTEALTISRQLAKDNPAYLSYEARTLNNLGNLVSADTSRRSETERLYTEALTDFRQLAKDNPAYLPVVVAALNNLGNLVSADSRRPAEAECLFREALTVSRQLAKDNPWVYLPYVAITLHNLGNLVKGDSGRRAEAEALFAEEEAIKKGLNR